MLVVMVGGGGGGGGGCLVCQSGSRPELGRGRPCWLAVGKVVAGKNRKSRIAPASSTTFVGRYVLLSAACCSGCAADGAAVFGSGRSSKGSIAARGGGEGSSTSRRGSEGGGASRGASGGGGGEGSSASCGAADGSSASCGGSEGGSASRGGAAEQLLAAEAAG